MKHSIIIALILSLAFSCKKKDDDVMLFELDVTPAALIVNSTPGSKINFKVSAKHKAGLKSFKVIADPSYGAEVIIVDSTLKGETSFTSFYDYEITKYTSDYIMVITFEFVNNNGETKRVARQINVKVTATPVLEVTGINLSSKKSGSSDAYDIFQLKEEFSDTAPAANKDIEVTADSNATNGLSRSWYSPSGGKFVSYKGFDYVNATQTSIESAYLTGAKLDKVTNIEENDIIIAKFTRSSEVIYAAIKVVNILDNAGSVNDRYILNFKK